MGRVKAICVSEKKGEQKTPVDQVTLQVNHGIQGDAHSGNWHRQVSLLGEESVAKVEKAMDQKLEPGAFAENVLTQGIELYTLPIGTDLLLGSTICRVTQIGKECHQGCAIRELAGDCVMPREGIFAKVIRPGTVSVGDFVGKLWDSCVDFHGHSCGGLIIGYKAALYVLELMEIQRSVDEELVCIAENDACGIDGIQFILGCTMGKGNLILDVKGKQAFNFFNRVTGQSFRLVLKEQADRNKEAMLDKEGADLFDLTEPSVSLPEEATIYKSYVCHECGENTAQPFITEVDGQKFCSSCMEKKIG